MPQYTKEAEFVPSETLGANERIAASPWVVMKFGGTSVSTGEHWQTIAGLVRNRLDSKLRPLIVHSALRGVSNDLESALVAAAAGEKSDYIDRIRSQHYRLAKDLDIDGQKLLGDSLDELEQLVAGVRLIGEVSVRVRVRIMALGELMATRLGAQYLAKEGIPVVWQDARELLTSAGRSGGQRALDYLSAKCEAAPDPDLQRRLGRSDKVVLTQGFIARNEWGETVLLGRGGSDTSAAYFTARMEARRLEVWTDVPGMFTADPRVVPSARLLQALHYDEAQELASAGSTVLHPRCLSPLRDLGIPLFVRATDAPTIAGTVVSSVTREVEPQVKGICLRNGLTLISMDGVGMWQEVGFLARAFKVFNEHGVSVDLVSTSETNVTVSIDSADGMLENDVQRALLADLEQLCRVRTITDCSAVSLVGRKIRTIFSKITPAFGVFEEEKIHLMTQAANDLNLSFVVDQGQGPKLVRKLHASIIGKAGGSPAFGPSWEKLFGGEEPAVLSHDVWWVRKRNELLEIAGCEENAYVYDKETVAEAARSLLALDSVSRVLYAVKANFNIELLRVLEGANFVHAEFCPAQRIRVGLGQGPPRHARQPLPVAGLAGTVPGLLGLHSDRSGSRPRAPRKCQDRGYSFEIRHPLVRSR
jgi:diaminopimelate decarboxylase/aspartate kinase